MTSKKDLRKIILDETIIPKQWYNIRADMPNKPLPYYSAQTMKPAQPDELFAIFPRELVAQEMCDDRYVDIPEEVRKHYESFRPSPLFRALGLEKRLDTPARIYYKYEGTNATGSHKLNTAIPQAYYNKKEGIRKLSTETGAGQWGSALSLACNYMDMECTVYMVKISYEQKPYRRTLMQTFGATVLASPSNATEVGRQILLHDPKCTGSLGIAISEAVETAATRSDTNYSLGSVLNHVCMHQTVIGQEAKKQLEYVDEYPDVIIACCGGGSNFAGITFPFLMDKIRHGRNMRCIAVEPTSCPTLTKGVFSYDYGDSAKIGPIAKMYTLGHDFIPSGIHAGGLRYHGDSPLISQLYHDKLIEAEAYGQLEVFDAGVMFARAEGIIPAPESSHAIAAVVKEALKCREEGRSETILFNLSGNGYFDMSAYESYLAGKLDNAPYEKAALDESLKNLPVIE
ncbi:MAG TPA: TrpB-like pyridoxal phosphate-dependent enzyme [Clostridiales bacterium]|nr:TrpB-like pyridoxal phosphate-dependent enzyme [Clostridiales bacterium]